MCFILCFTARVSMTCTSQQRRHVDNTSCHEILAYGGRTTGHRDESEHEKKLPPGKCQFTSLLLFIFQFYKLLLLLLTNKTTLQWKCSSCFSYAVGGDRVLLETRVPSLFPPHIFPRQFFARSPPSECLKQAKA